MWSVVQFRRIGKEVDRDWTRYVAQRQATMERSSGQDGVLGIVPDRESGQQQLHGSPRASQDSYNTNNKEKGRNPILNDGNARMIVECTSDDDPIDPRNWPLVLRAQTIAVLCLLVFVQAWASASDSLANTRASIQYHVSPIAENLATAMCLFGIGIGCLFAGPLSESFGRNPVYLSFSFVYLCFVTGTALSESFSSQIVCRFFVGLSSSATLGINGASVRDMFRPVKRAFWFPLIAWVNVVRKCLRLSLESVLVEP